MDVVTPSRRLQESYWRANAQEKAKLLKLYPDRLNPAQLLRLHHLNCVELFDTAPDRYGDELDEPPAPQGAKAKLCLEIVERLMHDDSPVRPRPTFIWQGKAGDSDQREPDIQGHLRNASMTHLGCLEVVHLKDDKVPVRIGFVSFDDLRGVAFAPSAVFRYAKLFYEDGRPDEIVLVPLLYGVSFRSKNGYDRDGSMTRFCCHLETEGRDGAFAIGIGHQDFSVSADKKATLFGLDSVGELMFGLEMRDPRFDQKCRARGFDPAEIRRQMKKGGP